MPSWSNSLQESRALQEAVQELLERSFDPALAMLRDCLLGGHKVLLCGNGGSASQASHFAAELLVRFAKDRRAYPAIALSDSAAITAAANDYGYDRIFARAIEALGAPQDLLIAFSTSGKSANVREAIHTARHQGLSTLGFSGHAGMVAPCDIDLVVPSSSTARIQEAHLFLVHTLCEELDR